MITISQVISGWTKLLIESPLISTGQVFTVVLQNFVERVIPSPLLIVGGRKHAVTSIFWRPIGLETIVLNVQLMCLNRAIHQLIVTLAELRWRCPLLVVLKLCLRWWPRLKLNMSPTAQQGAVAGSLWNDEGRAPPARRPFPRCASRYNSDRTWHWCWRHAPH